MTIKTKQILWLALATLFVAAMVLLIDNSLAATAIAGTFTAVIGLFLGLDIVTMLHKTRELKPGDYKSINTHRYIIALFIFALLLAESFFVSVKYQRDVNSLYLAFGVGFLVVIGGLVGGVECNKIATDEGPTSE